MEHECKDNKMSWIIPYLLVEDSDHTSTIYRDIFGFEVIRTKTNEKGIVMHAEFRYHDMIIMCGNINGCEGNGKTPKQGNYTSPVCLYVYSNDLDALYAKIKKSDLTINMELTDQVWGDRMFSVIDPDGHQWSFAAKMSA